MREIPISGVIALIVLIYLIITTIITDCQANRARVDIYIDDVHRYSCVSMKTDGDSHYFDDCITAFDSGVR